MARLLATQITARGVLAEIIDYEHVGASVDLIEQFGADPGGGGLILDVRSHDGPGSHTVISHRQCLADRLHPDSGEGEPRHSASE